MTTTVTLNRHLATEARRAVRLAKLRPPSECEDCGKSSDIHGHHDDYAKPLELRWLCRGCHIKLHIARGEWRPHGVLSKKFREAANQPPSDGEQTRAV